MATYKSLRSVALIIILWGFTSSAHAASFTVLNFGTGCQSPTNLNISGFSLAGSCATGSWETRGAFDATQLLIGSSATGSDVSDFIQFDDVVIVSGLVGPSGFIELTLNVDGVTSGTGTAMLGIQNTYCCADVRRTLATGSNLVVELVPYFAGQANSLEIWLFASSGSAGTADFFHTATLTSVRVLDQNSVLVPGAAIVSSGGFAFPQSSTSTVPEPATFVLLSSGLLAITRRRRSSSLSI